MAEPTKADRERAKGIADGWVRTSGRVRLEHLLAQALADERERARAPFLALCDRAENEPMQKISRDINGNEFPASVLTSEIRRAAEETGQ